MSDTTVQDHDRSRLRPRAQAGYAVLVAAGLALAGAAPATAEEPLDLPGQIYDPADALSDAQEATAQEQIDELMDETGLALYVAFVDEFTDGAGADMDGEAWAQETS